MLCGAILCYRLPHVFLLTPIFSFLASSILVLFAFLRMKQGFKIKHYHWRLLHMPFYSMSTLEIPHSSGYLFMGLGFEWQSLHRQRLHLLNQLEHAHYLQISHIKKCCQWLSLLKPSPDIGGKPWLHGVGSDKEYPIALVQANRNSHTIVFGMTRVGKTRLMSILVNQDIRNNEAVLVLDPKGDIDLIKDMYAAAKAAGRLQDFRILHAGMPEISAKYNALASYSDISEVATRVTNAISAEGEGKQFKDFSWRFLNITAVCLKEMGETINYRNLAFFVTRPRHLLMAYCDKVLPSTIPDYTTKIALVFEQLQQIQSSSKRHNTEAITRADAVRVFVSSYIESVISQGAHNALHDSIIADLYHAAQTSEEYYGKITASLGPVFDKINKTAAGDIFSWQQNLGIPVIQLEDVVRRKQICYIGLDSMSNKAMSEAVGQAVIADLVSLSGRFYKENSSQHLSLKIHIDEMAEVIRDEAITLANKAGGAGFCLTAYTQTVNDLGATFGSNPHKYKMLLGNFGTVVMLRVANLDTARTFTECLQSVLTRSGLPSTTLQDKTFSEEGELFSTANTDVIQQEKQQLVVENDLFSLPKGQAFMLTQGGKVYKIRIPLPKNDENKETNIAFMIAEVNLCCAR
jgi:conjugative coupling factor TraD (TOL family)